MVKYSVGCTIEGTGWIKGQTFEMRLIIAIKGKTRWNRLLFEEMRTEVFRDSRRREIVKKSRIKWFGKVNRIKVDIIPVKMEELVMRVKHSREHSE